MSQKPHLDDFFAAARREGPVMTHDEIGELVDARHTQPPLTQHITWKGIGMTTVGFGLAAVLSYFAFFASGSDTAPSIATLSPSVSATQPVEAAPKIGTPVTPSVEPAQPIAAIAPIAPVPPVPPIRVEAPIKVDAESIVVPSADDMKRLGMKVDGGREVVIVQKVGKKFFVVNFGAKPFRVASQLESENPTDIEPSEILPVFVTNLDGTGILTASAPDEHTSIVTKEVHSSNDNGATNERTIERTQTNISVSADEDNADISIDHKELPAFTIDGTMDDSSMITAFADDHKPHGKSKVLIRRLKTEPTLDIDLDVNVDVLDAKIKDKLDKEIKIKIDGDNRAINIRGLDSMHKKIVIAHIATDSAMMQIDDLNKEMELVRKKVAAEMKGLKFEISDSVHNEIHKAMEELKNSLTDVRIEDHLPNGKKNVIKVFGPVRGAKGFVVPGFGELRAKINELVPMRVTLNADNGNGLIFWYEPTDAPAILPKQEAQAATLSAIENLTINPNPAKDHATVRFALKDAHVVSVSVHDILGKRLLEAGQINASGAGEFTHELDLSTLSQGMYLVVLTTDTGEQRIERILVNK